MFAVADSSRQPVARRLIAAVAVCLALVQASVLSLSAAACCCEARHAAKIAAEDCCPAGSHPPGECPLHRAPKRAGDCALSCNTSASLQLVLLAGAPPLARPATTPTLVRVAASAASSSVSLDDVDLVPHAPPPRS